MIRIGSRQPEQMQDGAFSARSIGWVGHGGCILTSHDSPMVDQVWLNIKVCFLEQVRWQQSKTWLQVTAPTPCHVPPPPRVSLINWQTKNTGHNLILPGGRGGGKRHVWKRGETILVRERETIQAVKAGILQSVLLEQARYRFRFSATLYLTIIVPSTLYLHTTDNRCQISTSATILLLCDVYTKIYI